MPSRSSVRIPRSATSIAFALDQLEHDDLESEDGESESQGSGAFFLGGEGMSASIDEIAEQEEALARAAAAEALTSHPIDFTFQLHRIAIVTTASLPWLTGTAVNPALRAAYLWRSGHEVTLLAPWVAPADQPRIFQEGMVFSTQEEQAVAVIEAIQRRVPFPLPPGAGRSDSHAHGFRLVFYKGRYDPGLGSIMPEEDIQPLVPQPVDCVVLEEPEHLTWYHTGRRWTRAFHRSVPVIGVMHTNYVDYAKREAGEAAAGALRRLNRFLCRQHTHKVIKLSDAVQDLPRQETCFVHGVSHTFLSVGEARAEAADETSRPQFTKGMYFLGKALWAKGFAELLERFTEHKVRCEATPGGAIVPPVIDVYGKGEQLDAITAEAAARGLSLQFLGAKDHLSPDMAAYRAFVNPSTSDVVATTTAEALAMGKWVVVPEHPCNEFFSDFANCLIYNTPEEFSSAVDRALTEDPAPLTLVERRRLSWEAATDRFLFIAASAEIGRGPPLARVAAKTGWLGYNVGYQVYAVASGVLDLIGRGKPAPPPPLEEPQALVSEAPAQLAAAGM